MARGTNLGQLVQMVRAEARLTTSSNAGLNSDQNIRAIIARTYEDLVADYTWPHLLDDFTVTLQAGQYLYAVPDGVTQERLMARNAFVYYATDARRWPIEADAITWEHYNLMDPEVTAGRMDPVRLWQMRSDDMIEVWPCPATDGGILTFKGVRKVTRLVNDADVCVLDDRLLVLFSAAEVLGAEAGKPKLTQAQQLLRRLEGQENKRRTYSMVGSHRPRIGAGRLLVTYARAG